MNNEIKEINIPDDILTVLGDLANGALNYYKTPITIEWKYKLLLDRIINLQQENEKLNNRINKCAEEILEEINKNNHLSVGVALTIRQKLIDYRELKENK